MHIFILHHSCTYSPPSPFYAHIEHFTYYFKTDGLSRILHAFFHFILPHMVAFSFFFFSLLRYHNTGQHTQGYNSKGIHTSVHMGFTKIYSTSFSSVISQLPIFSFLHSLPVNKTFQQQNVHTCPKTPSLPFCTYYPVLWGSFFFFLSFVAVDQRQQWLASLPYYAWALLEGTVDG
ncbi:hypothetical protein V8F20_002099 [Naviculisporaceae sp. PSN 640]